MPTAFYVAGAVAVFSTLLMLTRYNAIHALLYLIVSLLAVAVVFYTLGAPFVAALEVIIYAGAIMVLFVFAVMLLNVNQIAIHQEKAWITPRMWIGPGILAAILIAELVSILANAPSGRPGMLAVDAKQVGIALYGPYLIGVELASMLLLGGLVGAYHLGWRPTAGDAEARR
jgi:NADH-quinone oxidoreductase subunit J